MHNSSLRQYEKLGVEREGENGRETEELLHFSPQLDIMTSCAINGRYPPYRQPVGWVLEVLAVEVAARPASKPRRAQRLAAQPPEESSRSSIGLPPWLTKEENNKIRNVAVLKNWKMYTHTSQIGNYSEEVVLAA